MWLSVVGGCERAPGPGGGQAAWRLRRARVVVLTGRKDDPRWPAIRAGILDTLAPYQGMQIRWQPVDPPTPAALMRLLRAHRGTRDMADAVIIDWPARLESAPLSETFAPDRQVVVVIGTRRVPPGVYGHVRVAWAAGAEKLAAKLHTLRGQPRSMLLLHRAGCGSWGRRMRDRFLLAARNVARVTLLDEADVCAGDPPAAIRSLVTQFPHAGVLVSLDGRLWEAPAAMNEVPQTMPVATLGADPSLWPKMRAGRLTALVGPLDRQIGRAAAELLIEGLADGSPGPHVRTIECELVRPGTLDDFIRRYRESPATQPGP